VNGLFSRLRLVVWTAVLAVSLGVAAILTEIAGADAGVSQSLGILGLILAILAPRSGN
jgi:hypothetical protein